MSGGLGYPSAWSRHDVEQRIIQNEAMTEFYENKVLPKINGLKKRLQDREARITELKAWKANAKKTLREKDQEIHSLRESLASHQSSLVESSAQNADLYESLRKSNQQLQQAFEKGANRGSERTKLMLELEQAQAVMLSLKQQLDVLKNDERAVPSLFSTPPNSEETQPYRETGTDRLSPKPAPTQQKQTHVPQLPLHQLRASSTTSQPSSSDNLPPQSSSSDNFAQRGADLNLSADSPRRTDRSGGGGAGGRAASPELPASLTNMLAPSLPALFASSHHPPPPSSSHDPDPPFRSSPEQPPALHSSSAVRQATDLSNIRPPDLPRTPRDPSLQAMATGPRASPRGERGEDLRGSAHTPRTAEGGGGGGGGGEGRDGNRETPPPRTKPDTHQSFPSPRQPPPLPAASSQTPNPTSPAQPPNPSPHPGTTNGPSPSLHSSSGGAKPAASAANFGSGAAPLSPAQAGPQRSPRQTPPTQTQSSPSKPHQLRAPAQSPAQPSQPQLYTRQPIGTSTGSNLKASPPGGHSMTPAGAGSMQSPRKATLQAAPTSPPKSQTTTNRTRVSSPRPAPGHSGHPSPPHQAPRITTQPPHPSMPWPGHAPTHHGMPMQPMGFAGPFLSPRQDGSFNPYYPAQFSPGAMR